MNLRGPDDREVYAFLKGLEDGAASPREARAVTSAAVFGQGGPLFSDGFGVKAAPSPDRLINAYRGVAYACSRLNANGVSRIPLRLYVTTARGEDRPRRLCRRVPAATRSRLERMPFAANLLSRGIETSLEEVLESPLLDLLRKPNRSPDNPFAGMQSLVYYLQLCKELTGSAYWKIDEDGLSVPAQLWPLDPRVKPVPLARPAADGRLIDYYLDQLGERYRPEQIARFRFLSPRNPYVGSMGPTEACFQQLGIRDKFEATVDVLLDNVFHPSAIISAKNPDRPIGQDVKPRLEAELRRKFSRQHSGGVVVSDGSLQFDEWHNQPMDTGGLEISKDAKETAANCYDVPVTKLSTQTSNRASAEAGNYAHAVDGIAPRCEQLAEELTAWAHRLDRTGSLNWHRLIFAFDNPVPDDELRTMQVNTGYVKQKVLVPDEVREELGYGPRADGKGGEPVQDKPDPADQDGGKAKTKPTKDEGDD